MPDGNKVVELRIVGYRNYRSHTGKQEFLAEDLEDAATFGRFLAEVSNYESDPTDFGKDYILSILTPERAQQLIDVGDAELTAFTPQELIDLVRTRETHAMAILIAEARRGS